MGTSYQQEGKSLPYPHLTGMVYQVTHTKGGYVRNQEDVARQTVLRSTLQACCRTLQQDALEMERVARARAMRAKTAQNQEFARLVSMAVQRVYSDTLTQIGDPIKTAAGTTDPLTERDSGGPESSIPLSYLRYVGTEGQVVHDPLDDEVPEEERSPEAAVGGRLLLFTGYVSGSKAKFMVDTGATGNFVSRRTAEAMGMAEYAGPTPVRVKIADGTTHMSFKCARGRVQLQNYVDRVEFAVVDMDLGVDVILGTPWLQSLDGGRPQFDFLDMSMKFKHRGRKVRLVSAQRHDVAPGVTMAQLRTEVHCPFKVIPAGVAYQDMLLLDELAVTARDEEVQTCQQVMYLPSGGSAAWEAGPEYLQPATTWGDALCDTCWQRGCKDHPPGTPREILAASLFNMAEAPRSGPVPLPPAEPYPGSQENGVKVGGWVSQEREKQVLADNSDILANSLSEVKRLPGYEEALAQRTRAPIRTQPHDMPPFKRAYKMSQQQLEELRRQLDDLTAQGYIRPSSSPYGAPVLLVPKPGSPGEWRLVIDYRGINAVTTRSRYPIPNVSQLMDELAGAKVFSTLDMLWGFWQMPLVEEDKEKTAMQTAYGSFEWNVLPMGLTNSPPIYQSWMQSMLGHLPYVKIFIDDILVYSKDEEEHEKHLAEVLRVLREKKVVLKAKKAKLFRNSVEFLGHVLTDSGVHPQHDKIQSVQEWKPPANVHEIRQFLGLAGFYRQYVYNFSDKAAAMNDLLKKGAEWHWSEECQLGFEALKKALTQAPVLALPDQVRAADGSAPFVLQTDASEFALGGVLMQDTGDGLRVIAFESRTLNPAEQNYSTTERELLALLHCCKIWRHYLEDSKWQVQGDHRPLQWLFEPGKDLTRRQARWVGYLQEMGAPRIDHVPGTTIPVPDALSRRSDLPVYTPEAGLAPGAQDNPVDALRTREVEDILSPMNAWRTGACQVLYQANGLAWLDGLDQQADRLRVMWELAGADLEQDLQGMDQELHQVTREITDDLVRDDRLFGCSTDVLAEASRKEARRQLQKVRDHSVCACTTQCDPARYGKHTQVPRLRPQLATLPTKVPSPRDNQDWKLNYQEYHRWFTRVGPFDVDACCDPQGKNKLVVKYWSVDDSCLNHCWAGMKVWCNPPYNGDPEFVRQVLLHFKQGYARDPEHTSAVFILPEWDGAQAPWRKHIETWGFQALHTYPAGAALFTSPGEDEPLLTNWPVTVWYHPPLRVQTEVAMPVTSAGVLPRGPRRSKGKKPVEPTASPGGEEQTAGARDEACEVCGSTQHEEHMLLCDGCDKGYHTFCLRPKVAAIPAGGWYCPVCRPRKGPGRPRREGLSELSPVERETVTVLSRFRAAYGKPRTSPGVPGPKGDEELEELRRLILKDPEAEKAQGFKVIGDLVWRIAAGHYQLVVPREIKLREWALGQAHDGVGCGHLGRAKTLEKLSRRFHWRGMTQDVAEWCTTCKVCQYTKKRKHKPDGVLNPLPVPLRRWQVVAVDFVTGLPTTARGYNAIATWTDKLSKMVHLVPYKFDDSSAVNIARMYLDHIWRLHGVPLQIICDRDPRLVSAFFKDFSKLLGTKVTPTTAFHPQGDGQSENTNQTMEQILRTLVEPRQKDWDQCLSQVEFAINDSAHAVHGYTPFQLNYGEHVHSNLDWLLAAHRQDPVRSFEAQKLVDQVRVMVHKTREILEKANEKLVQDRHDHTRDIKYRVGDQVLLSTKNIVTVTDRGTKAKLRKPYCGPFEVIKVYKSTRSNPHAYKLNMPSNWKIHPVFKALYLEPYMEGKHLFPGRKQVDPPVPQLLENGQLYHEVDTILADREVRVRRGNRTETEKQWLVSFVGEGDVGNMWLPIESLCDELGQTQAWVDYEQARAQLRVAVTEARKAEWPQASLDRVMRMHAGTARHMAKYRSSRDSAARGDSRIQEYEEGTRARSFGDPVAPGVEPSPLGPSIRALVLFSGTGSVERMIHEMFPESEVVSVDITSKEGVPTHRVDIHKWAQESSRSNYTQYPRGYFDVIWASPPCTEYSQAKTVGTRELDRADACVQAALKIMDRLAPTYWFVENPRGRQPFGLMFRPFMRSMEDFRRECTYCKYGSLYRKPTNIWTNAPVGDLEFCDRLRGFCKWRSQLGYHLKSAQRGPGHRLEGSVMPGHGGSSSRVYHIPQKLLRTLFQSMKFGSAAPHALVNISRLSCLTYNLPESSVGL